MIKRKRTEDGKDSAEERITGDKKRKNKNPFKRWKMQRI